MNYKKPIVFLILVVPFFIWYGCKTLDTKVSAPVAYQEAPDLLLKMRENENRTHCFSGKFKASFETGDKSNSFSGNIRMKYDSLIWLSISPAMGIELFRLMITPDSLYMLNRANRTYYIEGFESLNALMNTSIDFEILQALILGNDFRGYNDAHFVAGTEKGAYTLYSPERAKTVTGQSSSTGVKLIQTIKLDAAFKIIYMGVKTSDRNSPMLEVNYTEFQNIDNSLFPFGQFFRIKAREETRIKIQFERINPEKELSYPFSIPAKYDQRHLDN